MIISEQWLREWIALDLDAQSIADCLTNAGLEVDGVESAGGRIDNLVVGRVLEVEKHPDADRLNLTKVDVDDEVLNIVCGAKNVRADMLVAVAKVGAKLPNGLKIKKAKVRGAESLGMLCSASELGLEEESEGLIELNDDATVGQRVDEYLQLDDSLIDIDLTPNRGDCLSIQGIARELKVLADGDYSPLDIQEQEAGIVDQIEIHLSAPADCPVYLGRVIKGIDSQAITPLWMQERLRRCGVKSISPVVDITNYVMLELGQPMHAFDLAKLDSKIVVRRAMQGEKIKLLDDSEAELDDSTLVIADAKSPIAIAGVMGGSESAIGDSTVDIVLEAAHFTRACASGKARKFGLHTESSHRFERGVDPELPRLAMERATQLVLELCGGTAGPINSESDASKLEPKPPVSIRLDRLESLLGMSLDGAEVEGILTRISASVDSDGDNWSVRPPSYRFDIEREADLVEEVARVKGYDNIPTAMPRIAPQSDSASEEFISIRQVRNSLVARDYREAITYSFVDSEHLKLFSDESPVSLANPLADNMAVMRTSLLPGLISAVKFNLNRQRSRIRLFESGASYHATESGFIETQRLAGVATGLKIPAQWGVDGSEMIDFYDVKSDLMSLLSLTGHGNAFTFEQHSHKALHPGQCAKIVRQHAEGGSEIGMLGRLHPALEKQLGVGQVFVFELDLTQALEATLPEFKSVSKFPSIKRDLSVVVGDDVQASELILSVKQSVGSALVKAEIFDLYTGTGVEEGMKSVSLSLVLQNTESTMTDEEAEKLMGFALQGLETDLSATLRS